MAKEVSKEKALKSDKRQTEFLIGTALILLGIIILYTALMQPRINKKSNEASFASASASAALTENTSASDISEQSILSDENIVINLNSCSAEDLIKLKGIGESKANAIIAYRNVIGSYSSTDEIKNISGISDKLYESIKDNITV